MKGSLATFATIFDSLFLKEIEERVAVYNSDDMTNLNVNLNKYQSISDQILLSFVEYNKEIYAVEEEVCLLLEIKNIQTLYLKIFEFNTETYYKKTLSPFNTSVNLDGLVASEEKNFSYKYPPNKKFIEKFSLP